MNKGCFFAFEGIDGSGKSTQIKYLADRIKEHGYKCFETCEPTGGPMGTLLRQILSGRMKADSSAIALLFASDRVDHLSNEIDGLCKKIEDGVSVISDRYYLSSYAYQSVDMPIDWVIEINRRATELLKPTCHIFIDLEPEAAIKRIKNGRFSTELFETKERLTSVRNKFYEVFEKIGNSEKIVIVNGDNTPDMVAEEIWNSVSQYYK